MTNGKDEYDRGWTEGYQYAQQEIEGRIRARMQQGAGDDLKVASTALDAMRQQRDDYRGQYNKITE